MDSIERMKDILARSERLASDDPLTTDPAGDPSLPMDDRVAAMIRRTGRIDGQRCFILETAWHAFRLHGFRPGDWLLRREGWDGATSVTPGTLGPMEYVLECVEADPDRVVHTIRGMSTTKDADAFFGGEPHSRPWVATRISGHADQWRSGGEPAGDAGVRA